MGKYKIQINRKLLKLGGQKEVKEIMRFRKLGN